MPGNPGFVRVSLNGQVLWQKEQRSLYSKYRDMRDESQKEIAAAVKKAAEETSAGSCM
jgi:hypothetical protein